MRGCLITPFMLGSMSVGLTNLIRHSFTDLCLNYGLGTMTTITVTPWPIFFKLHLEPCIKGGLKICTNGHGLVIKMAAMPIYGNT